jgi:hypothetical protein
MGTTPSCPLGYLCLSLGGVTIGAPGIMHTRKFYMSDIVLSSWHGQSSVVVWTPDTAVSTAVTMSYGQQSYIHTFMSFSGTLTGGQVLFEKNEGAGWTTVATVNLSGQHTAIVPFEGTVNAGSFRVRLSSAITGTSDPSVYIEYSQAPVDIEFVGDHAIKTLLPSGAGSYSEWTPSGDTPNYKCVDDAVPDEDATHVEAMVVGKRDLYTFQPLPVLAGSIMGFSLTMVGKTDTLDEITAFIKSGATEELGDTEGALSYLPEYFPEQEPWMIDPDTSSPFTPTAINALQAGVQLTAANTGGTPDTTRYDPLKGGCSIGPLSTFFGASAGTLGVIVKDNYTGVDMMLTCWHVIVRPGSETWVLNDHITQPSELDGGDATADYAGRMSRSAISSAVDCAVATVVNRTTTQDVLTIGTIAGSAVAVLGSTVKKYGRTTQYSEGEITGIDATVDVMYANGVTRTFYNQITITAISPYTEFSAPGDSGSVIVDALSNVVGLLFAGSPSVTIANHIADVLSTLAVHF